MMKKRLVAFGLAGVMLMGMSMNVFAANGDPDLDSSNLTGQTSITYTVEPTYTITIPASITYNKGGSNEITFTTKDILLSEQGEINIKAPATSVDLNLEGSSINGKYVVNFKNSNDQAITDASKIVTFSNADHANKTIKLVGVDEPSAAGVYKNTVTFTLEYNANLTPAP